MYIHTYYILRDGTELKICNFADVELYAEVDLITATDADADVEGIIVLRMLKANYVCEQGCRRLID